MIALWTSDREGMRRSGWTFILIGVALILFAVAVFVWPQLTGTVLVALIGGLVTIAGCVLLYGAWLLHRDLPIGWLFALIPGLAVTVFGLVVLLRPEFVATVVLVVAGILVLIAGIADIAASVALARVISWWWLRLLRGVLFAAAGLWMIFTDVSGLAVLGVFVALWALVLGAISLALGVLALRA